MNKISKLLGGTAIISLMMMGSAFAVSIEKKADMAEAPAALWAKIGGWCAIKDWHPAIAECEEKKDGDVVRRILTLGDGAKIVEKLTGKTATSYSYVIEEAPLPIANYSSTLSVVPNGEGSTIVWKNNFDAAGGKTDAEAKEIVAGVMDAGLNHLLGKK